MALSAPTIVDASPIYCNTFAGRLERFGFSPNHNLYYRTESRIDSNEVYSIMPPNMRLAMAALFASHGISFVCNYLLKGEYAVSRVDRLMAEPYRRVVVMHIALLAGGFFAMSLGSPAAVLLALVVLKTIMDAKPHLREHRRKQESLQTASAS